MLTRYLRAWRGGRLAAAVFLVVLLAPAGAASARAKEIRVGSAPTLPAGAKVVASAASIHSLQLTIALEPRDPVALGSYASGVSTPGSADYHHYLTTAEFRARFAPTAATVSRVEASLRKHGLKPSGVDASGLSLDVTASSGAVEHAFRLRLGRVRLRSGGDAFYNEQAPALDAAIAPDVQAVVGLDTLYPMRSDLMRASSKLLAAQAGVARKNTRVATGGPQPCSRAQDDAPGSGGYTADQVASYYNFSSLYEAGAKGQGVTVALFELEPNSPGDVAAFQQCYGTHTAVSYVKVDGGSGSGDGSGEAALDIDQIISFAPKVKLLVYQGPNSNNGTGPYKTYQEIADQDVASVVSTSWGDCEPEETESSAQAESTIFEQMAIQGQTLVAAAGDSGSTDCFIGGAGGNSNNSLEVDDPSSQPYVTGAGGSSLELGVFNLGGNGNSTYPTPNPNETVWNNSYPGLQYALTWGIAPGAGGGGISSFWPMPGYQSQTVAGSPWLNVVNPESSGANCGAAAGTYCREVPDVSADADPMDGYMTYWNGDGRATANAISGWQSVGGTSAAAPLWAAVFAVAESSAACDGNLIGFANPALYETASSSQAAYTSEFNDVTNNAINQAGDDNDLGASGNTSNFYEAGAGYDMATGLGTPNVANLAPALCRQVIRVGASGIKQSFVSDGANIKLASILPTGQTGPVTYSATDLPPGLHLNTRTGVVTGTFSSTGVYSTVFGASIASGLVGAHTYSWTVATRPGAPQYSLIHTSTGKPILSFKIAAGQGESALKSVVIKLPAGVKLNRPLRTSAVKVTGAAGGPIVHSDQIVDGNLVITFKQAHSPDTITFGTGSLAGSGKLTNGGATQVQLVLRIVDAVGSSTTVRRTIHAKP